MNKKEDILKKHEKHHKIWCSTGKNVRWYTYLPAKDNSKKLQLIAKTSKEALITAILKHYNLCNEKKTLATLYPDWLNYKSLHTNSTNGIRRIDYDWKKYYLNQSQQLIHRPLHSLSKLELEEWALNMIHKNELTKKQYYNMTLIIRQCLDYAVEKNIIEKNYFDNIKINSKLFCIVKKPDSKTQVFFSNEEQQIIDLALQDFQESKQTSCLAIPFAFYTGTRIGEIVALKWTDIENNMLHIQRMEVRSHEQHSNGTWGKSERILVEHAKTSAGNRKIYLIEKALNILSLIQKLDIDSEFIFTYHNERIHSCSLDHKIRKYCNHIGITEKSMHKIRKTYISKLIDNNVNINLIREQVGHEDERTTYHSYCFNRNNEDTTLKILENALV